MGRGKPNPSTCIILPDTDDEDEDEDDDEEEEGDDDDDEEEEMSSSSYSSSDENNEASSDDVADDDEEDEECSEDDEIGHVGSDSVYERIVDFLKKGGSDLETLKVEECKVYLRKHGLRLTGNKEVCILRIKEHWRIKDGNGEKLYPRSSFAINCTGDVCKGDIVLFTQKVYGKFDKVTRSGGLLGKRTVAGKVVKESYGTLKQQHTFTVEVLWSKGVKQLQPLCPLLVKGRNLYRLKTYRRRWHNEAERSKILAEKHKRGAAARGLRARNKAFSTKQGSKRKRHSLHTGRSPKRRKNQESGSTVRSDRGKYDGGCGKAPPPKRQKPKKSDNRRVPTSSREHVRPSHTSDNKIPTHHTHSLNSHQLHNHRRDDVSMHANRGAPYSYGYEVGSASSATRAHFPGLYSNTTTMPVSFRHYPHDIPYNHVDPRNRYYNQNQAVFARPVYSAPLGLGQYSVPVNNLLHCATPGCMDLQTKNCVTFSCARCCRRTGRRCLRHQ